MCLNSVAAVTEWNRNSISKLHRRYFCFKVLFCKYVGIGIIENGPRADVFCESSVVSYAIHFKVKE